MILFVVFDGPDKSGKTTLINEVKNLLEEGNMDVSCYKFPDYSTFVGKDILHHLKTFKPKGYSSNVKAELNDFSLNQMINKILACKDIYNNIYSDESGSTYDFIYSGEDGMDKIILLDRFVLSQYIYDKSWVKLWPNFYLPNQWVLESFDRAKKVFDFFKKTFENAKFISVICKKSSIVTSLSKLENVLQKNVGNDDGIVKDAPRVDEYDSNIEYQNAIKSNFNRASEVISGIKNDIEDTHFVSLIGDNRIIVDMDSQYSLLSRSPIFQNPITFDSVYGHEDEIIEIRQKVIKTIASSLVSNHIPLNFHKFFKRDIRGNDDYANLN